MALADPIIPENIASVLKTSQAAKSQKLLHINARSLQPKKDLVTLFLQSCKVNFDMIMFTETWYTDDSEYFVLPRYNHFVLNRKKSRGGGVSILTVFDNCEVVKEFSAITDDYEVLCIKKDKALFAVVYRPPNGSLPTFLNFFDSFLSYANDLGCALTIGGDFNIDTIKDSTAATHWLSVLKCNNFWSAITSPTRVTLSTASLLDTFVTNSCADSAVSGVLCSDVSDHMPIFIFMQRAPGSRVVGKQEYTCRVISPEKLDKFREAIHQTNWDEVYATEDADECYNKFITRVKTLFIKSFPTEKRSRAKNARKPWVTKQFLRKIKRKNKLYQSFMRCRDLDKWKEYKQFRNKLNKEMEKAKNEYYHRIFDTDCLRRSENVWKRLNEILNPKTASQIEEINIDGKVTKGKELANMFNDFFLEIGNRVDDDQIMPDISPLTETLFLTPTCPSEVSNIFLNLKNSRSRDADDLEIKPIKYVMDLLTPVLTHIFNLALSTGTFPKGMQVARVTIVHKGGDKYQMGNYRPISILPVFSKGLEKIINARIDNFTRKHDLLTECQHGFRKKRSTESALSVQKEAILENFERKELTLGLYLDFSKAFDRVNHTLLLVKLERYGFRGLALNLLCSYLKQRVQFVEINNVRSTIKPVKNGVPQGSILGPILFLFYVNDITKLEKKCKFIIYADDCTVFVPGKDLTSIVPLASSVCCKLKEWSHSNHLVLNETKTKCVVFRAPGILPTLPDTITLGPYKINVAKHVNTLGVVFSEHMTWNEHINHLSSKLQKIVGTLRRHRYVLPQAIKRLLYQSLFNSQLNYCSLIWGTTTAQNLQKLTLLQKKAVRAVENVPYLEHTRELFIKNKIIKAPFIYAYKVIQSYKRAVQGNLDSFLCLANLRASESVYSYRYQPPWQIPFSRTNYGQQRLCHTLPYILNNFHRHHREVMTLSKAHIQELFVADMH